MCINLFHTTDDSEQFVALPKMVIFLFTLLTAVVGALASPDIHYNLEKAEEYFQNFIQQYKKQYSSIEEKAKKFEVFKQSLIKYNKLNLENEHAEFGKNLHYNNN